MGCMATLGFPVLFKKRTTKTKRMGCMATLGFPARMEWYG